MEVCFVMRHLPGVTCQEPWAEDFFLAWKQLFFLHWGRRSPVSWTSWCPLCGLSIEVSRELKLMAMQVAHNSDVTPQPLYRLSLSLWFIGTNRRSRGPPTGGEDESVSPAHLATEEEMAAPDDSWVWCACLRTKFSAFEAWVWNQNNRNRESCIGLCFFKAWQDQ